MKSDEKSESKELEVFMQGEGIPEFLIIRIDPKKSLVEIIAEPASGLPEEIRSAQDLLVLREDDEHELPLSQPIATIGLNHRERLHISRCRKVKVGVNFNHLTASETFPPSATVGRIKKWAVKEFKIDERDSTEHALQLCGTVVRPNEDTHIGSLTRKSECSVCFDLVPKKRVEGAF